MNHFVAQDLVEFRAWWELVKTTESYKLALLVEEDVYHEVIREASLEDARELCLEAGLGDCDSTVCCLRLVCALRAFGLGGGFFRRESSDGKFLSRRVLCERRCDSVVGGDESIVDGSPLRQEILACVREARDTVIYDMKFVQLVCF